jgi:hypothetical protein
MATTKTRGEAPPYCNRCAKPAHATAILGPYQLCDRCSTAWFSHRDRLLQGELAKFVRGV